MLNDIFLNRLNLMADRAFDAVRSRDNPERIEQILIEIKHVIQAEKSKLDCY